MNTEQCALNALDPSITTYLALIMFKNLHHELAQPFPSTTFLQLDLVAVEDVIVKVHVIPVICDQATKLDKTDS